MSFSSIAQSIEMFVGSFSNWREADQDSFFSVVPTFDFQKVLQEVDRLKDVGMPCVVLGQRANTAIEAISIAIREIHLICCDPKRTQFLIFQQEMLRVCDKLTSVDAATNAIVDPPGKAPDLAKPVTQWLKVNEHKYRSRRAAVQAYALIHDKDFKTLYYSHLGEDRKKGLIGDRLKVVSPQKSKSASKKHG